MSVPLAVGIIGAVVTSGIGVITGAAHTVAVTRAAAAADNAALAAADTAYGDIQGVPCEVAAAVAAQHNAQVLSCELIDWKSQVVVQTAGVFGQITKYAAAG